MLLTCGEMAQTVVWNSESSKDLGIRDRFLGPEKAAETWPKPSMSSIPPRNRSRAVVATEIKSTITN